MPASLSTLTGCDHKKKQKKCSTKDQRRTTSTRTKTKNKDNGNKEAIQSQSTPNTSKGRAVKGRRGGATAKGVFPTYGQHFIQSYDKKGATDNVSYVVKRRKERKANMVPCYGRVHRRPRDIVYILAPREENSSGVPRPEENIGVGLRVYRTPQTMRNRRDLPSSPPTGIIHPSTEY